MSLTELVEPERVKAVLRHYHDQADGKPNAFAMQIAKTLVAVARFHVEVDAEQLKRLKRIASKLPSIPFDLTAKNKALIDALKDERLLAALFALPERLMQGVLATFKQGRVDHGSAHVALAVAMLLVAPMRGQNLIAINFRRHVRMPNGSRGLAHLLIPADETKTGRADLTYTLDAQTTDLLKWYRAVFLPSIGADPNGDLFAMPSGKTRGQSHLATMITSTIEEMVGVRMTPHQFRHLAADLYLREHPQDFESMRQLLGHSYHKTTLIYAGLSGERASRNYGEVIHRKWQEISHKAPRARLKRRTPKY
jgi:integrase